MNSQKPIDVLTIGDCCVDLILSNGDMIPEFHQKEKTIGNYILEMGGSNTIFASQAAKLGLNTAVIGKVGDDAFGNLIIDRLIDAGVIMDYMIKEPSLKTGITVHLVTNDDRAMLTYTGTIDATGEDDILPSMLDMTRHFHIGSYFLMQKLLPHYPEIIKHLKVNDSTISLDTNWDPSEEWDGGLAGILPLIDVLLPNENEAMAIARASTLDDAIETLKGIVPVLVVKRGKDGATVHAGDEAYSVPAIKVPVVDTIGAGDSFDAGFVFGFLNNRPLDECARIGCICGSLKTREAGGVKGQPRLAEIEKYQS
ncbi:MAG TPA: sugar kinase [Candidatus Lokiarchaeia archaeon]|nr:sugar kinase [Candidatus Lokiarchaeia archaeon]